MTDSGGLLDSLFIGGPARGWFSDQARLQGMLDFEAALARAEAKAGVIPQAAIAAIVAECEATRYDIGALAEATAKAGNPAIPLVKALTARVAQRNADAARYVHWGATSQDVMDTGLVLQLRQAIGGIEAELARLSSALADLAQTHRDTPMVGRTWLQHALPITFGVKVAGWLDAMERHRQRLQDMKPRLLVLQFGGAAGTLAALGDRGLIVSAALAEDLELGLPAMPWHAARDRVAEFGTVLGLLVGSLSKIARDIALLMQTDIGEASEPSGEGRGGSSTMPHKRNPVTAAVVLAAGNRAPQLVAGLLSAMTQEHERGLGGWHAEWMILPELVQVASGALTHMADTITGLEVDADHMRANLDVTNGLIMAEAVMMALGSKIGRLAAHDRIEAASHRAIAERRHLRDVLKDDDVVTQHLGGELDRLFDPLGYIGVAPALVDRVLAARRK
ncbi:MAG TPA: 3-carboxy-cis,cis-muconate cycloisomerase [Ferrovibrio sp.]|jgi:3-carboxy-cis,cis-muconate cycloisomerase|uniref:3-carboxy-cis,cis-muconate cycloisomerase n=1 Tax=Ferrovibrio sp. TaxID=1917215 RepID=UPI002ED5293C